MNCFVSLKQAVQGWQEAFHTSHPWYGFEPWPVCWQQLAKVDTGKPWPAQPKLHHQNPCRDVKFLSLKSAALMKPESWTSKVGRAPSIPERLALEAELLQENLPFQEVVRAVANHWSKLLSRRKSKLV